MPNQLPLPRQIQKPKVVAEIRCQGRYGAFTSTVYALNNASDAIGNRVVELLKLGNTIIKIDRKDIP